MIATARGISPRPLALASLSLATHREIPAILRKLGRLTVRWEMGGWTATLRERGARCCYCGRGRTVLDAIAGALQARLADAGFVT